MITCPKRRSRGGRQHGVDLADGGGRYSQFGLADSPGFGRLLCGLPGRDVALRRPDLRKLIRLAHRQIYSSGSGLLRVVRHERVTTLVVSVRCRHARS